VYVACRGLTDPGNGPNKPTATIIESASWHHGALIFTLVRARFSESAKNVTIEFLRHIIDVWHVPSVYVACRGLSDLGNGPNKPTATTIGEYSASWHHGALIFPLA